MAKWFGRDGTSGALTQRYAAQQEVRRLAMTDHLTGLADRREVPADA